MRNILALIAAFTLSSTSTMSVIACNNSNERGTTNVFDWSSAFKETNTTTDTFFNYLLNNPNSGWGKTLYTDINQYINLSILKNSPEFKEDYLAALTSAKSEMENTIKSLQAKYGRSWEKQWKKVLGDDDVNTYIDNILKKSALGIIQRNYVTSNYKDYKYYNQNEINIWLKDLWEQVKSDHNPDGIYDSVIEYVQGKPGSLAPGKYANKIWIVANANSLDPDLDKFDVLNNAVINAMTWTNVTISLPVVKTTDDNNDANYEIDSYNTIDGLLSDNQSKIAKVMLRNQELIWTRQIVIPFDSTAKPLEQKIDASQFKQNETKINEILNNINKNGFDQTFTEEKGEATTDVSKTGDLGLVDITKSSQDNSPFYYYLYRYVTSYQGVGKNVTGIQSYNLRKVNSKNLTDLIPNINRDHINLVSKENTTSQYNDLVYMEDQKGPQLPDATINNGPGIGIFIDKGGIHFLQTPGITYQQENKPVSSKTTYEIIKDFKNHRKDNYQWSDLAPLSERPGGLSDSPYLDYLQTDFLLQKNTPNIKPTFDLNDALTTFTGGAGGTGSIGDATWWDYNLYFNENSNLISWNIQAITGSSPLDPIDENINSFAEKMKSWFDKTKENRWNNRQGININATFKDNIIKENAAWDALTQDAPIARMDTNIANYLDVIGKRTLWWYDPSIISS